MNHYDIALFDLDGTISESGEGILFSVRSVFEEMGKPTPDEKTISSFIGPPLQYSFKKCGFSAEEIVTGTSIYKKHFIETGIYKNHTYKGIPELLETLRRHGVRTAVATTKYQPFSDRIIKMLGIDELIGFVAGATADDSRRSKEAVIRFALENLSSQSSDRIVMIGDTRFDAEGAILCGCDFIGCLYGYGSREEMQEFFPHAHYVNSPSEIADLIITESQ